MTTTEPTEKVKIVLQRPGLLKFLFIGFTALLAIMMLIILLLVSTENGTRWLIQRALSDQEHVNLANIEGTLINSVTLKQLHYQDANNFRVIVAELKLQWHAQELLQGRIHIGKLLFEGIKVNGQPVSAKDSESNGEIPKIPFLIVIDQLEINQFNWHKDDGDNDLTIQHLQIRAILEKQILKISDLSVTMPQLKVQANTELHLQPNWPLTADLNWVYDDDITKLQGQLNIAGNSKHFDLTSFVKGDIESTVNGFIKLSSEPPEFKLKGQLQKLQWPLQGVAQISSKKVDFYIEGTLKHYQAKIMAVATAKNKTDFSISLLAKGNQEGITIDQLLLKPKQGQLKLDGQLSWKQGIDFNLALNASKLNPMEVGLDIPGQLELKSICKGYIVDDAINAELTIQHLTGLIYDQPLNAHGTIKLLNKQLTIQPFYVSAGRNQLTIKGQLNEQKADLAIDIAADDLQTAWPTLAGSLNGNILIQGNLTKPIIISHLQGQNIHYADKQIEQLSVNINYQHGSMQLSKVDFSASKLQLAEQRIDKIILRGQGNQTNHQAKLQLSSALANLKINTMGQWDGKQWLGHISQLVIGHPQFKQWRLQSPTDISIMKDKQSYLLNLKNSCLIQGDARLCLSAQGSSEKQVDGKVSVLDLPLALIQQWLPEELSVKGTLSAHAQLLVINKELTAEVNANIANGLVKIKLENDQNEKIPFTTSALQLKYQNEQLKSHIHVELGKQDFLTAKINADKANASGIRQLSGSLQAKITNMRLIDSLISEISQLQGLFVADLQLTGNSQQPVIEGSAQWQNGQLEIAKLGNTFQNINVKLNSVADNPKRLQVEAELNSGDGKLSANGYFDLIAEQNYPFQMKINGEKFLLSRLPEAEVILSPILNIHKTDELTRIDGLIKIDSAEIKIKSIPETAIVPSVDEVIIATKQVEQKKNKLSVVDAAILIDFGKDVHFSGFGLETFLVGQLEYVVQNNKQSMHGRAEMRDGSYRSYGQDLTLRKGEFLFNGPTDNPFLNIEAFRKANSDNVTAVLSVTGPLKALETRVYTEPTLSESEALSYLVTGKSLKNLGKSEGGTLATAAFNYGAGQLSWLSDQFGIDEFEFKEGDTVEDSAVKLGHYLNPDLYIGVTTGLFSSSYAASLRYQLNKHFSLGTRAGETQRIDLKYHLESD